MSLFRVELSGDETKRVSTLVMNFVFVGFGVLEWALVVYIIDLIVRSI